MNIITAVYPFSAIIIYVGSLVHKHFHKLSPQHLSASLSRHKEEWKLIKYLLSSYPYTKKGSLSLFNLQHIEIDLRARSLELFNPVTTQVTFPLAP